MGKSLELLGMAAFNVMLVVILFTAFIKDADPAMQITQLTEGNVTAFVEQVSSMASAKQENTDAFDITKFFVEHINDDGQFSTTLKYRIGDDEKEEEMALNKKDFIAHILQDQTVMSHHESRVDIDYIKITDDARRARVISTTRERGLMPIIDDFGDENTVPVIGTSYCEQTLVLSQEKKVIQMKDASCTTYMEIQDDL